MKTVQFNYPVYIGDPLNAVKIFNEKQVDELILLDIAASRQQREPDYNYIEQLATECFMPVTYGGGVNTIKSFQRVISCGIEKVALNAAAILEPELVENAAVKFGISSVVASIDASKSFLKKWQVYSHLKKKGLHLSPIKQAIGMEKNGAGEILLQCTNRDGMMDGYDLELIKQVSSAVTIPVIACGGAGSVQHFADALKAGASAVAAGSKFVFRGKHKAVLINYLSSSEMAQLTEIF